MTLSQRLRIRVILILIGIIAVVLSLSLYSIQIGHGNEYAQKADKQYAKPNSAFFNRGTIYFQSKDNTNIAAATVDHGKMIFMNPKQIGDTEQTYEMLSQFTNIDKDSFVKYARNSSSPYRELVHKIDDETAQSILTLKLDGIYVSNEYWRSYPGNGLAAQTLGIIGEDISTSTIKGKYGIEKYYDEVLQRRENTNSATIFAKIFADVRDVFSSSSKEGNIVTTIEPTVQGYLEKVISDTQNNWSPDSIGGVIMRPDNGEIIAIASFPSFNGNETSKVKNPSLFSNPLVEYVYEMGSIMKPLTIAVGIDTGAISATSTYNDEGTMTLNGKTIGNWDRKAHGITTIQDLLSQSLNMGAATVALRVGANNFSKYFFSFGLGERTGIDLPNEVKGLMTNLKTVKDIDIATASYGQGIAVSPIEMVRALSILPNGGYLVTPHVVKEIDYLDGSKKIVANTKGKQVIAKESAREVTNMLVKVVDKALKNGQMKMDHYSIAAKTGTAQIPDHKNGGYYGDRYLHSFFGYFPAYNPEFIVFLYQIYPRGANYASETLTDPFDSLTKFLISYYNIAPDR